MFTTFLSLFLLTAPIRSVFGQISGLWIDTPGATQCQSTQIQWSDTGNAPYDLLVVPADDMCGNALVDLGNQTSTEMSWTVNVAGGTQIILSMLDSVGNEAWSGTITVGDSNDGSCLTNTPSSMVPSDSSSTILTDSSTTPTGSYSATPFASTPLTVTAPTLTSSATSSSPKSSASGTSTSGLNPTSGAPSTRPLGIVPLFSSAVLAVVAFVL